MAQALGLWLVAGLLSGVAMGQTTLTWDPSISGGASLGGSGTWSVTTPTNWWNGTSNVGWTSGTARNAVFAGTAGTVSIPGSITVGDMRFDTAGYILSTPNDNNLTLTLSSFSGNFAPTIMTSATNANRATLNISVTGTNNVIFTGTIANNVIGNGRTAPTLTSGRFTLGQGSNYTGTGIFRVGNAKLRYGTTTGLPPQVDLFTDNNQEAILEFAAGNYSGLLGSSNIAINANAGKVSAKHGFAAIGGDRTFTITNTADVTWLSGSETGTGTLITSNELVLGTADSTGKFTWARQNSGIGLRLAGSTSAAGTYTKTIRTDNGTAPIDAEIAIPLMNSTLADRIGALTKTGSGVLAVSAVNTYTGATTVSAGGLLVNGTTAAASAVTVASGAFLGGTGFVGGAVTVNGGIAPGSNGIGTLTTGSGVTWNSGNSWLFQLGTPAASLAAATAGTNNDFLNVTGAFNPGTGSSFTFNFANSGSFGWYKLVDYASTTFATGTNNSFQASNLPAGATGANFVVDSSSTALYVEIVPEPESLALAAAGVATIVCAVRRRRRTR